MLSFVVIAAKPGRSLDPELVRTLDRPQVTDTAFRPEEHLVWKDRSGTIAFLGWQAATDVFELGSNWHHDDRGVTAFTRHLWPKGGMWDRGESWASQLHRRVEGTRIVEAAESLGGVFTMLSIGVDGRGGIATDPLAATVLYRAENDDVVAYSSRAALAARAVTPPGREPARDAWSMGWHTVLGYIVGDGTGFVGTTALPAGSWVELDPRFGSRVRNDNPTPWTTELPGDREAVLRLAHEDLAAEIRSVASLPGTELKADITGGRDSRLILALLVEQGLADRFTYRTMGEANMPDRVVGESIAPDFRLDHAVEEPVAMDPALFSQRLATHVFHTSGMLNAWDLQGGVGIARNPTVAGFYGEILRTYFHFYPPSLTRPELVDRFLRGAGLRTRSATVDRARAGGRTAGPTLLTPEAHQRYTDLLTHELVGRVDNGASTSQDRLDSFYIRQRIRRWMATMEELNGANRVHPLYSPAATRAAFALGDEARRHEVVPFEVMRRASAALAKAPFADRGWPAEVHAHLEDSHDYTAPPVKAATAASTKWQIPRLAANHDLLEAYVLDGAPDEMWEVFDKKAATAAVRGPNPTDVQSSQRLYGLLTAAYWLGRYEQPIQAGDPDPKPFVATPPRAGPPTVEVHREDTTARPQLTARVREMITNDTPWPAKLARMRQAARRRVAIRLSQVKRQMGRVAGPADRGS